MPLHELAKLKEIVESLEDALQVSSFTIEQDAQGNWPAYNPAWKAKMIIVEQSDIDGSWPSYLNRLKANTKVVILGISFSHPNVKLQWPPYGPNAIIATRAEWAAMQRAKGLQADGTPPPPVHRTPDPHAHLERKTAIAMGRQVPVDPERLDRS